MGPTIPPFRPDRAEDWEPYKDTIEQLYWVEDRKLPKVMEWMKEQYDFDAT